MKLKALIAAPIVAWLMIASAATIERPLKWSSSSTGQGSDSYQMGVDTSVSLNGKPALSVLGTGTNTVAYADVHQWIASSGYVGKHVRFSGMLRTTSVDQWAGVYMFAGSYTMRMLDPLAMPPGAGKRGTDSQWQPISVVIDVPQDVETIRMGLVLVGNGQAWLSDLKFEEVGTEVPVTTSKVEVDTAQVLRERESYKQWLSKQPLVKAVPANLELRTK
jgi:hypothetical protein